MKDLYYVLMFNHLGNVKQCKTLIKHGLIKVNGLVETDAKRKITEDDCIEYQNRILNSQPFTYIMLNKPQGYICANKDEKEKCVIDLIEEKDCFCLGRLDRDTTGLLLLTNDKNLKKLLLPQNHVDKVYLVEAKRKLSKKDKEIFARGIVIDENIQCIPAKMDIIDDYWCYVTIQEGKYHQIKKMFLSLNNEVVSLKRISFDQIQLDSSLKEGDYRFLTKEERNKLIKKAAQC